MMAESSLEKLLHEKGSEPQDKVSIECDSSRRTIMVVDDESSVRDILIRKLPDYYVVGAESGEQAVALYEKIRKQETDIYCVIMDAKMPGMNGWDATNELHKRDKDLPIIMLTAFQDEHNIPEAVDHKLEAYVTKGKASIDQNGELLVPTLAELSLKLDAACSRYSEILSRRCYEIEIERLNKELQQYATSLEQKVEERTAQLVKETELRMKAEELAGVAQLSFGLGHDLRNILSKAIQSGIPVSRVIDDVQALRELYRQGKIDEAENHVKERNLDTRLNMASESFETMNDSLAKAIQNIKALEGYTTDDGSDFTLLRVEDALQRVLRDYEDRLREVKMETQFVNQPYSVKGNPLKLYRIFLNILINSLEALEEREDPRIMIKTRLENGKHITVIEDNGIGVSEEVRKNIFNPYTTTKGLSEGRQRGLGLSITYDLVKQHGGNIEMESRPGEYTRVIVSFDATD